MNTYAADQAGTVMGSLFFGWLIFCAILVWLTPIVIAVARENRNRTQVAVVDLLLGWTGIGWVVALVMAFQAKPQPLQPVIYPPQYLPQ